MSDENFNFDLPVAATPAEIGESFSLQEEQIAHDSIIQPEKMDALQAAIDDKQKKLAERTSKRARTTGEIVGDAAASVGLKGTLGLSEFLYGATDATSRVAVSGINEALADKEDKSILQDINPVSVIKKVTQVAKAITGNEDVKELPFKSIDDLTEKAFNAVGVDGALSERFGEARSIIDENLLSDPTKAAKKRVAEVNAKRAAGDADRVDELIAKGYNETFATVLNEGANLGESIISLASEPLAAIDTTLESLPQMFVGGAAGKVAINQTVKGMSKEKAAKFLASKEGKKAATEAATKAGIASTGITEGLSNGVSAKAEVLGMSAEKLAKDSPLYNQLVEDGLSHQEAAQIISNKVFDVTAAISGIAGAVSSKYTGAAKFEGNLFNPDGTISKAIAKTIKGGVTEAVEESIQGGAGQFGTNVAIKENADKTRKLSKGVGEASGQGVVAGSLSAGATGGVAETVAAVKSGGKKVTTPVKQASAKVKATTDTLKDETKIAEVRDVKSKSYDPEAAFDVASDKSQVPTEPEAKKAYVAELQTHAENFTAKAIEAHEKASEMPTGTQAEKDSKSDALTAATQLLVKSAQAVDVVNGHKEVVAPKQAETIVDDIVKSEDVNSEQTQKQKFELLGSMTTVPKAQLETLVQSDALNSSEKSLVSKRIDTLNAIEEVTNNTSDGVNNEVMVGGNGRKGIQQHQAGIETQMNAGNKVQAENALVQFHKFATDHVKKVKLVTKAYAALQKAPKAPETLALVQEVATRYTTQKGTPLEIHINSNKTGLISTMQAEGKALQAAFAESKALVRPEAIKAQKSAPVAPKADVQAKAPKETVAPVQKAVEITDDHKAIAQEIIEHTREINAIEATMTRTGGIPTDRQSNAIGNYNNAIAKLEQQLTDQGVDLATVKKAAEVKLDKNKVAKMVEESLNPKTAVKFVKAYQEDGTYNKRTLKSDLGNKARYGVINTGRKFHLVNLATNELIKSKKSGFDGISEYITTTKKSDEKINTKTEQKVEAPVETEAAPAQNKESTPYNMASNVTNSDGLSERFLVKKGKTLLNTIPRLFEAMKTTSFVFEQLNETQDAAMDGVRQFNANFVNSLRTKVVEIKGKGKDGEGDFRHFDMSQYFLDADGKMDDNVESTVAMHALNWIATRAGDTLINKDSDINSILGKDDEAAVSINARNTLGKVGSVRARVAESIGKDIVASMGITAKDDTSIDQLAKIELSFGLLALETLKQQKLITDTPVPNSIISALRGDETVYDGKKETNFIRIQSQEVPNGKFTKTKVHDKVEGIVNNIKGSDGLLDTLFGIKSHITGASFSEPKKAPTKVKNSNQSVPTKISKILLKHSKRKHLNKMNVAQPFMFLSHDAQMEMAGANADFETNTHITEQESVEAVNNSIEKQINDFHEHIAMSQEQGGLDTPFYFEHEVWKNMRAGMKSNTVNLQSSKIHRHLLGMRAWEVKVDPSNPEQFDNFMVGVAESIGISVDKEMTTSSIEQAVAKLQTPVMQKGIAAIKLINSGADIDNQAEVEADLLAAVKEGGEKLYSLDGLVAYAQMDGDKPFKTNLFREVDGVTNGVIIGLYQLAAQGNATELLKQLERGGMFSDDTKDWAEWYQRGNNDSYQDMALSWISYKESIAYAVDKGIELDDKKANRAVKILRTMGGNDILAALDSLVGSFTEDGNNEIVSKLGRDLTKNPLMITNYGAAMAKVLEQFGDKILTDTMKKVAKAVVAKDQIALDELNKTLSFITKSNINFNIKDGLTTELSVKDVATFQAAIAAYYGSSLEGAIKAKFGTFIDNRTQLNNAMKVAFEAFHVVYKRRVAELEADKGSDISAKEKADLIAELQDMVPAFKSPLSENADDSIVVMKEDKERQTDSKYRVEAKFKGGRSGGYISKDIFKDGGVSGTILGIHSIDAATMYGLLEQYEALNVHDAAAFSILDTLSGTEALNKSFYDVMTGYNLREEFQTSMERSVALLMKGENSKLDAIELTTALSTGKNPLLKDGETLTQWMGQFAADTTADNKIRQEVTERLTNVAQYNPGQGARYVVSPGEKSTINATESQEQTIIEQEIKKDFDNLQSAPDAIDPDNFNATSEQDVNGTNADTVFVGLGSVGNVTDTPDHTSHLSGLLNNLIVKVIEPFKLKMRQSGNESHGATTGDAVYINEGMGTLVNGTQMSAQEIYVHELIHNVTQAGIEGHSWARNELVKLFKIVEKDIKPEDFLNRNANGDVLDLNGNVITTQSAGYASELAAATERHDYIFNNVATSASGKNAYLHEFAALGLTNKAFMNKLATIGGNSVRTKVWQGNVGDTLSGLFSRIADALTSRITGTGNIMADKKLMLLAEQLANLDHRKQSAIYQNGYKVNEAVQSGITKFIVEPLSALLTSDTVVNSKVKVVRTVGNVAESKPIQNIKTYGEVLTKVGRRMGITEKSFISSFATELKGASDKSRPWHRLLRHSKKVVDQARLHIKTNVAKQVRQAFLTPLSKEDNLAINKMVLKTDLTSIAHLYSAKELANFMRNPAALEKEIASLETQFSLYGSSKHYYRKMTTSLGSYMATGVFTENQSLLNANNIARQLGTGVEPKGDVQAATELIETLASLHAINFSGDMTRNRMADIITREDAADSTNNGVTFLMQVHADSKARSLTDLFAGNPTQVVKGFTKEIYNPSISYVIAPLTEEAELLRQGYQREGVPMIRDNEDPNRQQMYRYVSKDGLVNTWMAGISSFTNRSAKGTDLIESYSQGKAADPVFEGQIDSVKLGKVKAQQAKAIFGIGDTSVKTGAILVPIINARGDVSGYRHMMSEQTKDTLLEKDNNFDNVMGAMEADISAKTSTVEVNEKLVAAAKIEYDAEYKNDPDSFVLVGSQSSDTDYRELYRMFPKEMRMDIKATWGQDGMYVRRELVTLMFGQRKISAATKIQDTKAFQALNTKVINMFDVNLGRGLQNFESAWQEVVTVVKDLIVIKSGVVFLGNVTSNLVLLKTLGVSNKDMLKHHSTAIKGAKAFQADTERLEQLEREIRVNANVVGLKAKQVEIARLKNELAVNPVADLINEGVFQSIVEDVDAIDDQFTYKSKLQEWITPSFVKEGSIPQGLKDVGNNLVLAHNTAIYKSLRDSTQLSDFVARYVLHQHNLDNGMSKEKSIDQIVDVFINYDLPTHKAIQYANDVGLVMFTKFFVRIQKIIFMLMRDKPANMIASVALQGALGDISDVTDSVMTPDSVMGKFNTPLDVTETLIDVPLVNLAP